MRKIYLVRKERKAENQEKEKLVLLRAILEKKSSFHSIANKILQKSSKKKYGIANIKKWCK